MANRPNRPRYSSSAPQPSEVVTRTKDEAWAELEQLERRIKDTESPKARNAAFTDIASERSECSSYMKNGDL